MKKILFVVPIFDTEGPTTGRDDMFSAWKEIISNGERFSEKLRFNLKDGLGNPMIFSWFLLDWVGYSLEEESFKKRGHAAGYHAVFDKYRKTILTDSKLKNSKDGIFWHYHHPPKDGTWGWNPNWADSNWYEDILNHKILERSFFPSVFRAGGYVQDNASSDWLEKWIPFDYSNNSPAYKENAYNWLNASKSWLPYHPHKDNYQMEGDMRRFIARCLPVYAKGGSNKLTENDVEQAFIEAETGEMPILSFSTHDYYKSSIEEFETAHSLIKNVGKKYSRVEWRYEDARSALRKRLSPGLESFPSLSFSVKKDNLGDTLLIKSNHGIFGTLPYVVLENNNSTKIRADVKNIGKNTWRLDLQKKKFKKIGVAGSDYYGNTNVKIYDL